MFFKLDLIQSYGSGKRCAKNALSLIGSPALKFEPDNDTDDYTSMTAFINEEFARVKAEEEGVKGEIENGSIGREQFWILAAFKHPTHQISFHTQAALDCLIYIVSEVMYDGEE